MTARLLDMESISRSRFIRISPRKLKLVCDLVAGKNVEQALSILEFTPKKGAKFVSKTLLAAVANARDQQNIDEDKLYVKRATADTGPTWKRSMQRAHMHATPIFKRTSHLTVVVDEQAS
ncbi:MAG TPA: 50S ribosomal protein L22 [Candidatus Binataceae bacterium]